MARETKTIIVNAANIASGGSIGVATSIYDAFAKNEDFVFTFLVSPAVRQRLEPRVGTATIIEIDGIGFRGLTKLRSFHAIERRLGPDLVFTVFGPTYWKPKVPHVVGFAWPHLIYRESPYFEKMGALRKALVHLKIIVKRFQFKKTATCFITESNDVSKRLQKALDVPKSRIFTVHNCLPSNFSGYQGKGFSKLGKKGKKTVLMVSAYYPHKDFTLIPDILKHLALKGRRDVDIVTTLPSKIYQKLNGEQDPCWRNLGPVDLVQLPSVYEQADAVLHTSLLECFSVAYLEAMFMCKPIVVPSLPFATNVCREVGFFYRPDDPDDAATVLLDALAWTGGERLEKGRTIAESFGSSEKRAEKYLEIIAKVLFVS